MGKHFKRVKEKELANGKIVLCPFDDLLYMPQFLTVYDNMTEEQLRNSGLLVSCDGRWFIDSRLEAAEYIAQTLELLVNENRINLEGFRRAYAAEFKGVKLENVFECFESNEKRGLAIAWCMIPGEIKRRNIAQMYHKASKIKAFPGGKC